MTDIELIVPVIVVFGIMSGFACLFIFILTCCQRAMESELQSEQPTRNQPIPPQSTAAPSPIAPPLIPTSDPPPYSEVVDKPYFYPAPVEQPPCYDNIAMDDLSIVLNVQDQRPRIISERPPVSAAITLER